MQELLPPVKHTHVDSPSALADLAELGRAHHQTPTFDLQAGINALRDPTNNPVLVERARSLLDKLMLDLPSTRREFASSVVGAFVNVGAYAAGEPECMWMPYATEDEYSPINIWIQVSASYGIVSSSRGAEVLTKRGTVLMALIIALSERRIVTLNCYHATAGSGTGRRDGSIVSWRVPTAPLVIAQIVTNLCDPNVVRDAAYFANDQVNGRHVGNWLQGHDPTQPNPLQAAHDLGADPLNDIIIAGLHLEHEPMIAKPTEWLNEKITQALKGRDE